MVKRMAVEQLARLPFWYKGDIRYIRIGPFLILWGAR